LSDLLTVSINSHFLKTPQIDNKKGMITKEKDYHNERRQPLRRQIERKEVNTARNFAIASAAGAAIF
jgi:hypothetical protein